MLNKIRLIFLVFLTTQGLQAENIRTLLRSATAAYAKQNYSMAIDLYSQVIELDTNNLFACMGRGEAHGRAEEFDKAEADFNKAIALATNNIQLSTAFLTRGFLFVQTTNFERAVNDYSKAIELNPSYQSAYVNRAFIFNLQHLYDLSILDCNMAIMLNPDAVEPYRLKGSAYAGKQEIGKSIEAFTKAIEIDTNDASSYFSRALAYFGGEKYQQAIADYNRVIQFQPTNAWAFAYMGLTKSRLGDFKNGISDCRKGVQLDTNCYVAYNNLAWLQAIAPKSKWRDGKAAVANATRACELTEWKNAYCLGTLAAADAEVGNFDDAVKWESKCIVIGLPEKEMVQAHKKLNLFEGKTPYHIDK